MIAAGHGPKGSAGQIRVRQAYQVPGCDSGASQHAGRQYHALTCKRGVNGIDFLGKVLGDLWHRIPKTGCMRPALPAGRRFRATIPAVLDQRQAQDIGVIVDRNPAQQFRSAERDQSVFEQRQPVTFGLRPDRIAYGKVDITGSLDTVQK